MGDWIWLGLLGPLLLLIGGFLDKIVDWFDKRNIRKLVKEWKDHDDERT